MEKENNCPYNGFCENLEKPSKEYDCLNFENCPGYLIIKTARKTWVKERDSSGLVGKTKPD